MSRLIVDFCGEVFHLDPDDELTFGRTAELIIDENPYLHRQLGALRFDDGRWWLHNVGSFITMTVRDLTSATQIELAPDRQAALTFADSVVQFEAGPIRYELELRVDGVPSNSAVVAPLGGDDGATISIANLPLTHDQRLLIVALAEPLLRSQGRDRALPSNRAAAHRLGWPITRFNRKLDNVCDRLHKAGVAGLRGDLGALATDRRSRLVDHATTSGLIDATDLEMLEIE